MVVWLECRQLYQPSGLRVRVQGMVGVVYLGLVDHCVAIGVI